MINGLAKITLVGLMVFFVTSGFCCGGNCPPPSQDCKGKNEKDCWPTINLTIWKTSDSVEIFQPLIDQYQKDQEKNKIKLSITYKQIDENIYEQELLTALAKDQGPDIFEIRNDWLPQYQAMIKSVDKIMSIEDFDKTFVDVAHTDLVMDGKIYAMPQYVDTLALYYNSKILEQKKLSAPPATWEQLKLYTQTISEKTEGGNIALSGIALGTGKNIKYTSEILYAMMMQNNVVMTSPDNKTATFANYFVDSAGSKEVQALKVLDYYTSFANKQNQNYNWSEKLGSDIEAFEKGQSAMIMAFSSDRKMIEQNKDPKVKVEIAEFPKVNAGDQPTSYAKYWSLSVSKKSLNSEQAWDFIKYVTVDNNKIYLNRNNKPTALRRTAQKASNIFDKQAMYAKSFYKARYKEIDELFRQMPEEVIVQKHESKKVLDETQNKVTEIMQKSFQ